MSALGQKSSLLKHTTIGLCWSAYDAAENLQSSYNSTCISGTYQEIFSSSKLQTLVNIIPLWLRQVLFRHRMFARGPLRISQPGQTGASRVWPRCVAQVAPPRVRGTRLTLDASLLDQGQARVPTEEDL